jgi:hypothetical protein
MKHFLYFQYPFLSQFLRCVNTQPGVAQNHRLPFDRLRVNGGVLKSFKFSIRAELVESNSPSTAGTRIVFRAVCFHLPIQDKELGELENKDVARSLSG